MDLSNKNVLITGGAKRVGAALVEGFIKANANVFLHYNRSEKEANEMKNRFPQIKLFQADFNSESEVLKLIDDVKEVDVLVNNASYYQHYQLNDASNEFKFMQINYLTPVKLIELLFANSNNNNEKVAINFLDQILLQDNPNSNGAYFKSRKKLLDATLQLAKSLGEKNIRVNGVAVGPVLAPEILADKSMSKTIPTLPLRRKVELNDLVNSVLFLAGNSSITGAILPVDCGQHL